MNGGGSVRVRRQLEQDTEQTIQADGQHWPDRESEHIRQEKDRGEGRVEW